MNLVNLVILEVGEWRGFLSQTDKDFIEENGFENHMYTGKIEKIIRHIPFLLNIKHVLLQCNCLDNN